MIAIITLNRLADTTGSRTPSIVYLLFSTAFFLIPHLINSTDDSTGGD
jgi:hypothetical protein